MASNTKKYIIWGSVSVLAIGGGILLYNWYNKNKDKDKEKDGLFKELLDKIRNLENSNSNNNVSNDAPPSSGNVSTQTVNPFQTEAGLKEFQQWVIQVKGDTKILAPFGADGKWGGKSRDAVNKYYKEYIESKTKAPEPAQVPLSEALQKDIQLIFSLGEGDKAKMNYLNSTARKEDGAQFITNWASAIRARVANPKNGTTFSWNNKTYESYSGNVVYNGILIGKKVRPLGKTPYLRREGKWNTPTTLTSEAYDLGIVRTLFYNNNDKALFAYVPDKTAIDKWIHQGSIRIV
jgi:hypothetical protein